MECISPVANCEHDCNQGQDDLNGKFSFVAMASTHPLPSCLSPLQLHSSFSLGFLDLPNHVNYEDDEGHKETEYQPVVNEFQVGCLRQRVWDALKQSVHDQQCSQSNLRM